VSAPVLVLQHGEVTPPGWLAEVLAEEGIEHHVIRLHAGDHLPDDRHPAALVSLGGVMAAYEEDAHPFLAEEKRFLRAAVRQGVPVLGICLGSQLLADALGGRVFPGHRMEAGFVPIRVNSAGRRDPVLRALTGPVLAFHSDTWEPPPGARVLARSAEYPQAFRAGTALGLQFHAEAPAEVIERWVAMANVAVRAAGVDPDTLVAEAGARQGEARRQAWELFGAWLDHIRSGPAGRKTGTEAGHRGSGSTEQNKRGERQWDVPT
jgi:GMP synthase (glutamine-hydrolysing)